MLRIPSISAITAHARDVQRAGEWVAVRVTAASMEHAQVLPTGGHLGLPGAYERVHRLHIEGREKQ